MRKNLFILLLAIILPALSFAQDTKFGIKFSGFVKTDIYWDTRQTVSVREGQFMLYPANEKLDADGNDINAKANFNMLSIQTRLRGTITGPDALGAKTSGVIEGAFFGNINTDINGFRLRHAFVKLDWGKITNHFGVITKSTHFQINPLTNLLISQSFLFNFFSQSFC